MLSATVTQNTRHAQCYCYTKYTSLKLKNKKTMGHKMSTCLKNYYHHHNCHHITTIVISSYHHHQPPPPPSSYHHLIIIISASSPSSSSHYRHHTIVTTIPTHIITTTTIINHHVFSWNYFLLLQVEGPEVSDAFFDKCLDMYYMPTISHYLPGLGREISVGGGGETSPLSSLPCMTI